MYYLNVFDDLFGGAFTTPTQDDYTTVSNGKRTTTKLLDRLKNKSYYYSLSELIDYLQKVREENSDYNDLKVLLPYTSLSIYGEKVVDLEEEQRQKEYQQYLKLKEKFEK